MDRNWTIGVALLSVGLVLGGWGFSQTPKEAPKDAKKSEKAEPEQTDITEKYKEMNSDKFAAPSNQFRKGHVKPRNLDEKAIQASAKGFSIQLPAKAPIPTPTIYKGMLFASGGFHSKEFYCFDAVTGKFNWGVDLDDDGPTSAVVEDDVVVFNTESCTIFALDAKTGKQLWSYWLGDPLTSTPTIAGGLVFTSYPATPNGAPGNDQQPQNAKPNNKDAKQQPQATHALACIELKTGKILWQKWLDSDVMSAPVAIDGEVYATSFGGTVYRYKQKDGAIVSAHRSRATSAPVIVGNNVYLTQRGDTGKGDAPSEQVAGIDRKDNAKTFAGEKNPALYLDNETQLKSKLGKLSADLDASNGFGGGAPANANPTAAAGNIGQANVSSMQAFQGSRILNSGGCNFNCMGDQIACTDPTNGKTLWSLKLEGDLKKEGGFLASAPASAGGHIFVSSLKGTVMQIDPAKKSVIKTFDIGAPMRFQPAIVDGRIYVGTENGNIVCVDTGDRKLTGWYTWGANSAHTNLADAPK